MSKKEYVYFLVHTEKVSPALSFFSNRKKALQQAKLYDAKVVKHLIVSKKRG